MEKSKRRARIRWEEDKEIWELSEQELYEESEKKYKKWKEKIEEQRKEFEEWIEEYFYWTHKTGIDWELHFCEVHMTDGVIVTKKNGMTYYYEYINKYTLPQRVGGSIGGMGCKPVENYEY